MECDSSGSLERVESHVEAMRRRLCDDASGDKSFAYHLYWQAMWVIAKQVDHGTGDRFTRLWLRRVVFASEQSYGPFEALDGRLPGFDFLLDAFNLLVDGDDGVGDSRIGHDC